MMIDAVNSGTMLEIKWRQRSLYEGTEDRTVKVILLNPILTNIGTMQQRTEGWKCHVVYDSHEKRKEVPHNKYYEIKWLKMCERQGNLKIISASDTRETNK
jgi:hypothetical protein